IQDDGDETPVGVLNVDERVLVDGDIENAEEEVRRAVEKEVVSELVRVTNLDDVFQTQVPEVVQEIRRQIEEE
ncbi:MAG: hypothetical protein ACW99G_00935, partial [Candidatus Thorarchaeota archaeon]